MAPHILPLLERSGTAVEISGSIMGGNPGATVSQAVTVKADEQKRRMFLHGFRLTAEKAAAARRKKNGKSQEKRHHFEKGAP